jgi:DNA-binding response OmpR family regulator
MDNPLALVIEDDADISEIFSEALRRAGFAPEKLQNGKAAMARLAEATPAIVVLDLNLPFISGESILRYIRAERRLKDTRVIVTSAEAHMAESLRSEADLVLLKPVSYHQLYEFAVRLRSQAEG